MTKPIYTAENCHSAYQLNWGLTIYWNDPVESSSWLEDLSAVTEQDGVRILKHHFSNSGISQFFLSTKPSVSPSQIIRSVKGRMQTIVRKDHPKAFRRNYAIRSIGSATREAVENYVADQLGHHRMADSNTQDIFNDYQLQRSEVDLSIQRKSSYGVFWYNLHVVIVNEERYMEVRKSSLEAIRDMIFRSSDKHGRLVSRLSILADHLHLTVGCNIEESPSEVVVGYMNNLAYALEMKPVFRNGYYVGTIGEYDRGAV